MARWSLCTRPAGAPMQGAARVGLSHAPEACGGGGHIAAVGRPQSRPPVAAPPPKKLVWEQLPAPPPPGCPAHSLFLSSDLWPLLPVIKQQESAGQGTWVRVLGSGDCRWPLPVAMSPLSAHAQPEPACSPHPCLSPTHRRPHCCGRHLMLTSDPLGREQEQDCWALPP